MSIKCPKRCDEESSKVSFGQILFKYSACGKVLYLANPNKSLQLYI